MAESRKDNTGLIDLSAYISKNISALPSRMVEGIRMYLGYNAVYGIRELDNAGKTRIIELFGDSRYKRDHILYKEKLAKTNLFEMQFSRIVEESATSNKMVWRMQDLGHKPEEFFETEYGQRAGKSGFGYIAMIVPTQPLCVYYHSLSIYKSKIKGDFTDEELSLLESLAALYNVLFAAYLENLRHQALKAVFNYKITDGKRQVCIMDTHFDPIFKTSGFEQAIGKLFKKGSWTDFVLDVIVEIDDASSAVYYEKDFEEKNVRLRVCVYVPDTELSNFDMKLINVTIDELCRTDEEEVKLSADLSGYGFTARENEVLEFILQGMSIDEISDKLFISKPTVRTHISHIYKKLGVNSRLEVMSILG